MPYHLKKIGKDKYFVENKKTKFTSAPSDRSPKKAEKNNDEDDYDF